ncbi:MAG: peptidylprolyl isomerase [Gammaproteobacteria bacterium]|nr:peptidylprolyl isomerase [Gammaproteobacteria bacterium]
MTSSLHHDCARINGIPLHAPDERLDEAGLRQRACIELLRQAAQRAGLLDAEDMSAGDGALSQLASDAIETLLDRELHVPVPSVEDCQRHFAAHGARYAQGERVRARHILFAVTSGADVVALRKRAETCLLDVRCRDAARTDRFAAAAQDLSNCPSGAVGGDLGWLNAADCAPEFARAVFGVRTIGVLPRLVHSRFGLHVVEVLERVPGTPSAFADVQGTVASELRQQAFATALRHYLALLAGTAEIDGVDLDASHSPLLQ